MIKGRGRLRAWPVTSGGGGGQAGLTRWKASAGGTFTLWGDSTTQNAIQMWSVINNELTKTGGPWEGITPVNLGLNGQTMVGASVSELAATNPRLVYICFGLNDVRIGGVDAPTFTSRIQTKLDAAKIALPNCDFICWTPNPMLSTDPGATGYVTPLGSTQAYTDIMRLGYAGVVAGSNTIKISKMDTAFGQVCPATSPLMNDILHPSNAGQDTALTQLIPYVMKDPVPINLTASAAAWTSNPNNPWTVYARALEDTRYCVLRKTFTVAGYSDQGNGDMLLDAGNSFYNGNTIVPSDFNTAGDFIWMPNGVYTVIGWEGTTSYNGGVRVYAGMHSSDAPLPTPTQYNGKLYRKI